MDTFRRTFASVENALAVAANRIAHGWTLFDLGWQPEHRNGAMLDTWVLHMGLRNICDRCGERAPTLRALRYAPHAPDEYVCEACFPGGADAAPCEPEAVP